MTASDALSAQALETEVVDGVAFAAAVGSKNIIGIAAALFKLGPEVMATFSAAEAEFPGATKFIVNVYDGLTKLFPQAATVEVDSYTQQLRQEESDSNAP